MTDGLFDLNKIRMEISYNSFEELRLILSFYKRNQLCKINIPCKNKLKKDFLLSSIKIAREEFPSIDIIPHFSILHEFRRNRINTLNSLFEFIKVVNSIGCSEILLVSGSQKRSTLDSVSALSLIKDNSYFSKNYFSFGVAFNPYLPDPLFQDEIARLEQKINSGLVSSIWIQFGTDYELLQARILILKDLIISVKINNSKKSKIILYGSILIPSKLFLARFKYRPWKGVYCSQEFLHSVDLANNLIEKLLKIYREYDICPLIETNTSSYEKLQLLKRF